MAYGFRASLEHAAPHIDNASHKICERIAAARVDGSPLTSDDEVLKELIAAVSYIHDALRYLKEGAE